MLLVLLWYVLVCLGCIDIDFVSVWSGNRGCGLRLGSCGCVLVGLSVLGVDEGVCFCCYSKGVEVDDVEDVEFCHEWLCVCSGW